VLPVLVADVIGDIAAITSSQLLLQALAFGGFSAVIIALLALDLGVLNRGSRAIAGGQAMIWSASWALIALGFAAVIYFAYDHGWLGLGASSGDGAERLTGRDAAIQYITGYLVEYSLSLDNVFLIATIFAYFRTPAEHQHRVLFWGIIGVLLMRGVMVAVGSVMIAHFEWVLYLFGALLLVSAMKMLALRTETISLEANIVVRTARRFLPIHSDYVGGRFVTRVDGRLMATPLMLVLLMVECGDAIFALDSIPAIFGITRDPFIVFTSNVFAVLGLRSLYFALAAVIARFRYLKVSLAFILAFVGLKMLAEDAVHVDPLASLGAIAAIFAIGIGASLVDNRRGRTAADPFLGDDVERATRLTLRQARRLVILVVGLTVVALGLVMLIGPGPGIIVIPIGLAILATEFVWARRLLRRYRNGVKGTVRRVTRVVRRGGGKAA
jgi:tellurite resistance protein TerC